MSEARRESWERTVEWPLTAVALLFLAAYAWPILDVASPRGWLVTCRAVTWAAWAAFVADYLVRVLSILNRRSSSSLRGRVITYVLGSTVLTVSVASLAVLDAERGDADANIQSFGDAVWWSLTTVTTVGYGDRFPVTSTGRAVAVGLMVGGIALLGVVTASFASWLLERVTEVEDASQAATRRDVEALTAEVAALRRALGTTPAE